MKDNQSGFPFPMFNKGSVKFVEDDTASLLRASIIQIALTLPGERIMNPEFGCLLKKLQFDNVADVTTMNTVINLLTEAIAKWEPRVTVTPEDISVSTSSDPSTQIAIQVNFRINNPDSTTSATTNSVTFDL